MSMYVLIEDDLIEDLGAFRTDEKIGSYEDAVNEALYRFFSDDESDDDPDDDPDDED